MTFPRVLIVFALTCLPGPSAHSQGSTVTLPTGTPLPVQIGDHLPLRVGQGIRARLMYPVFAEDELVLPAGTVVVGDVVSLRSDRSRRIHGKLGGDFTPFSVPVVQFKQIDLGDGRTMPLASETATDGAPIFRIIPPPPRKGGFVRQQIDGVWQVVSDDVGLFTAPGKGDRLLQFVYSQLPYHPQRMEKGTAWTVRTTKPMTMEAMPRTEAEEAAKQPGPEKTAGEKAAAAPAEEERGPGTWLLQAYLSSALSSTSSKAGQEIRAVVAEPIFNPDHTIAVPQGAVLVGEVTRAKPARYFGRAGVLRFDFREMLLPGGEQQTVVASLKGADSTSDQVLDSEGTAKPKPRDKLVLPILLAGLAARPLDQDGGSHDQLGKNAVGSNGFGVIGRIVGIAAGSANLAAGIGYYQTAISTYDRWIARGKQVTFARDTRVVIQTTERRSPALKPTRVP